MGRWGTGQFSSRKKVISYHTYLAFPQQPRFAESFPDDEATIVEAGAILLQPGGDRMLVGQRQEVSEVSVV